MYIYVANTAVKIPIVLNAAIVSIIHVGNVDIIFIVLTAYILL